MNSLEILRRIKSGGSDIPFALPDGSYGKLRSARTTPEDSQLLSRWRCAYSDFFFTRIKPDETEMLRWLREIEKDEAELMLILTAPGETPVGQMALSRIDLKAKSAEFGRVLKGEVSSVRDIFRQAASALLQWSVASLGLEQVDLYVFAGNHKAIALYERIGFHIIKRQYYRRAVTGGGLEVFQPISDNEPTRADLDRAVLKMMWSPD